MAYPRSHPRAMFWVLGLKVKGQAKKRSTTSFQHCVHTAGDKLWNSYKAFASSISLILIGQKVIRSKVKGQWEMKPWNQEHALSARLQSNVRKMAFDETHEICLDNHLPTWLNFGNGGVKITKKPKTSSHHCEQTRGAKVIKLVWNICILPIFFTTSPKFGVSRVKGQENLQPLFHLYIWTKGSKFKKPKQNVGPIVLPTNWILGLVGT